MLSKPSNTTLCILLSTLLAAYGCTPNHPKEQSAELNKTTEAATVNQMASTEPLVVFQAGLQDDKRSWNKLLPALAGHRFIALDRAGHGNNPPSKAPRDPCTIAKEQRSMLQASGLKPPYILVGHSLGGLYQYVYAKLFPSDVAGLILLDPTHPKHWETMQKDYSSGAAIIKIMRATLFSEVDRQEFDAQTECLNQNIDMTTPVSAPVTVLVSGRFRPEEQAKYQEMIGQLRNDWARILGVSNLKKVENSGHYIQKDNPEEVISAIEAAIVAATKK